MENKRLIDANAFQFEPDPVDNIMNGVLFMGRSTGKTLRMVKCCLQAMIDNAPTVDAVEVVRCKDCKHRGEECCCPMYFVDEIEWDDDGYIEVDYVPHDYTVDDGFCDRGERRTNERKAD